MGSESPIPISAPTFRDVVRALFFAMQQSNVPTFTGFVLPLCYEEWQISIADDISDLLTTDINYKNLPIEDQVRRLENMYRRMCKDEILKSAGFKSQCGSTSPSEGIRLELEMATVLCSMSSK